VSRWESAMLPPGFATLGPNNFSQVVFLLWILISSAVNW
jgi:hypothetical protein